MLFALLSILAFNLIDRSLYNYNQDFSSKIISTIHSTSTAIISTLYLTNYLDLSILPYITGLSYGFATYDSYTMIRKNHPNLKIFLFHHFIMITGNSYFLCMNTDYFYKIYFLNYLCEYAVIFLNISEYIYKKKLQYPNTLYFSNIMCIINFFIFRILNYMNIIYLSTNNYFLLFGEVSLFTMNCVWMYKLLVVHFNTNFNDKIEF